MNYITMQVKKSPKHNLKYPFMHFLCKLAQKFNLFERNRQGMNGAGQFVSQNCVHLTVAL